MAIVFARIDNRLIHGQVVEGWLPATKVSEVVVVSSYAAASSLMKKMLRMSLPSGYGLNIFEGAQAAQYLKDHAQESIFLILEDFASLSHLVDNGVKIESVNIGNTKYEEGKKEYGEGVYLNEAELALVKGLSDKGVKFDVRALPSSLSTRLI